MLKTHYQGDDMLQEVSRAAENPIEQYLLIQPSINFSPTTTDITHG